MKQWFEDMTRMASGAAGSFATVKQDMEQYFSQKWKEWAAEQGWVSRDEYQLLQQQYQQLALQIEALNNRVLSLEKAQSEGDNHA